MTAPILWWKGDGNPNESQTGVNAVWNATPAYDTGLDGQAFKFTMINGNRWGLNVANNALFNFDPAGNFSIRVNVKANTYSPSGNAFWFVHKRNSSSYVPQDWGFGIGTGGKLSVSLGNITGGQTRDTGYTFADSNWHDCLLTYSNGYWRSYVDGVDYSTALMLSTQTLTFNRGYQLLIGAAYFAGVTLDILLDDVRLYDQVITTDNIDDPVVVSDVLYRRYDASRRLNLTKFLPSMYQESETQQFTQFIEDFYNTMFDGESGSLSVSASDISPVSGDFSLSAMGDIVYEYNNPISASVIVSASTNLIEQIQVTSIVSDTPDKISILEKVNRLVDLKDPELIDIDYIQYFASNLGYNVDVYRSEIGNVAETIGDRPSGTSADDINDYLRFMVSNLPNWYKIKATDNAIKVMLYSFGLVGDLVDYYSENYLLVDDGGNWIADYEGDLSNIPKSYFCTPHFAIRIMVDESEDLIADIAKRESVIRAIKSIQPINTVFRNLTGNVDRDINMNMSMMTRLTRYMRITD